jgi:GNAT superfamily N-acetyltransferase
MAAVAAVVFGVFTLAIGLASVPIDGLLVPRLQGRGLGRQLVELRHGRRPFGATEAGTAALSWPRCEGRRRVRGQDLVHLLVCRG